MDVPLSIIHASVPSTFISFFGNVGKMPCAIPRLPAHFVTGVQADFPLKSTRFHQYFDDRIGRLHDAIKVNCEEQMASLGQFFSDLSPASVMVVGASAVFGTSVIRTLMLCQQIKRQFHVVDQFGLDAFRLEQEVQKDFERARFSGGGCETYGEIQTKLYGMESALIKRRDAAEKLNRLLWQRQNSLFFRLKNLFSRNGLSMQKLKQERDAVMEREAEHLQNVRLVIRFVKGEISLPGYPCTIQ